MRMIYDEVDGKLCSLESRLERLADERPTVIGRVLCALIDLHDLGDSILRDCDVLEDDEWTAGGSDD